MEINTDTIVAEATPRGRGGIGIVRVSGNLVCGIAREILGKIPRTRQANFYSFLAKGKNIIDEGIAIYFKGPNSFTGEDILELHSHGGPVVVDLLLQRILDLGARMARPGEFMARAFLNHKLDLLKVEATADLINAATTQAAQNAVRSLKGEFGKRINSLVTAVIAARVNVEAIIDFPDEEIEKKDLVKIKTSLNDVLLHLEDVENTAKQGVILRDGISVVIAGKPNAGKSSLLNCLSGQETAIVTSIPGTTRDVLRTHIQIDGLPINLIDTAGLHDNPGIVEGEGIKRALDEIKKGDHVLLLVDSFSERKRSAQEIIDDFSSIDLGVTSIAILFNKIDLTNEDAVITKIDGFDCIYFSAKTGAGLDLIKDYLKKCAGLTTIENGFSARRRHLDALNAAKKHIQNAKEGEEIELVASDLFGAQQELNKITGEFTSDDLLTKIFSEFCIGK